MVPIKFIGVGPPGYHLYNKVTRRGRERNTVSHEFIRVVTMRHRTHLLNNRVAKAAGKGPRIAS